MTMDAPDWERVSVTVAATGDVPDAPDWERIIVGSGGVPIGGLTNPMTTKGDIIVGGTAGAPARLGVGSSTQFLGVTSGTPAWKTPSSGGAGTNVILQGISYTNNTGLSPTATITANGTWEQPLWGGSQPLQVYTHNTIAVDDLVVINFSIFRIGGGGGTGTHLAYEVQDDSNRVLYTKFIADSVVTWPIYNYSDTISIQLNNTASAFSLYFNASGTGTITFDDLSAITPTGGTYTTAAINGYYSVPVVV
jgi:hypothetical protein